MSSNKIRMDDGSERSIDSIYMEYKDQLYRFIYRYTSETQLSIDIVQDTFEKLIKNKYKYDPEKGKFKTYLFQIAYNTLVSKLKRRQRFQTLLPFLAQDESSNLAADEKMSVQKALLSLTEEQRAVILLTYYHDLRRKEVAAILNIPVGTVKSRLHHALKKLRNMLEVEDDGQ